MEQFKAQKERITADRYDSLIWNTHFYPLLSDQLAQKKEAAEQLYENPYGRKFTSNEIRDILDREEKVSDLLVIFTEMIKTMTFIAHWRRRKGSSGEHSERDRGKPFSCLNEKSSEQFE